MYIQLPVCVVMWYDRWILLPASAFFAAVWLSANGIRNYKTHHIYTITRLCSNAVRWLDYISDFALLRSKNVGTDNNN